LSEGSLFGYQALQAKAKTKTQAEAPRLPAAMHPTDKTPDKRAKSSIEQDAETIEKTCQKQDPGSGKEAEKTTQETAEKTGTADKERY
jgi:hypothetical protein